ncbi:MAG TPA: sigma 54-interacting transcriptional regulator [Sedimentisphaerales bacterium]|nr:sigma 54-interacting transcriptional regulator [Sedimentisphaerales bacterium]
MDFESQKETDIILDSIADGVFTVDKDWRITSFNRAAEQITGVTRKDAIGRPCREVLKADLCEGGCALRETMETGHTIISKPVDIIDAHGRRKPITISTALLKDEKGQVVGGVETFRDMTIVEELRKQVLKQCRCEDIISRSAKVQQLFDVLPRVAESDCTVLIEGETGTGKELFARAVHSLGRRKNKPFIAVNCGALPDTLLESELFGYKAGAFTDAKKDKPGRFALAQGGTIFLDEIGDVSPTVQVRLLRVLQEKTYEPVGGVASVKTDARVITATNKNLQELVDKGVFRKDLFYRINVVRFHLPPLRERREDIPLLVDHFIQRFNSRYGKNICCVSNEVMAVLMNYAFPGNIRELENVIEHSFVLCQGRVIEKKDLPEVFRTGGTANGGKSGELRTLKQMEAMMIEQALRRHDGNRAAAARDLDIDPSTPFRKLKTLGLNL